MTAAPESQKNKKHTVAEQQQQVLVELQLKYDEPCSKLENRK